MVTIAKYFLVLHDNRIVEDSKCFRVRQTAQAYVAELQDKQNDKNWVVISIQTILD